MDFNDRRIRPSVHPDNALVGDPHYHDERKVSWVEREPAGVFRKTPRWRVHHLAGNDLGGSMHTSTSPLPSRKAALEAFEMVKGGGDIHEASATVEAARRDAQRDRRDERRYRRFRSYNEAIYPGSFGGPTY